MELKPCPFCGSKSISNRLEDYQTSLHYGWFFTECNDCFSRTYYRTEDMAVKWWNRRVTDEQN